MARRQLTLEEQLKGIRAAIRSKRTPPQLREGLRKRVKWLKEEIRRTRPRKIRRRKAQYPKTRKKSFWALD